MTTESRFERDLTAILEDLYLGRSPDYRDEVMAAAVRTRQRPSWTFAGRWIPMADIATKPVTAPRVPWRAIGLALVVVALALAAVALIVGSRQTKVPPPFGLAAERPHHLRPRGRHLYPGSCDRRHDRHRRRPRRGRRTGLLARRHADRVPPRQPARRQSSRRPRGRQRRRLQARGDHHAAPVKSGVEWAPDSELGAGLSNAPASTPRMTVGELVVRLSTDHRATPNGRVRRRLLRQEPFQAADRLVDPDLSADRSRRRAACVLDLATGHETVLATGGPATILGAARWSPDGSQVVYNAAPADDPGVATPVHRECRRQWNAQITEGPGVWVDIDAAWSPDGKPIAFDALRAAGGTARSTSADRHLLARNGQESPMLGRCQRGSRAAAESADGRAASRGEGIAFEWSPDSTSLVAFPSEASGHAVLIDPGRRHVAHRLASDVPRACRCRPGSGRLPERSPASTKNGPSA